MEYEAGVREALDKVFAAGEQDGNEHLIIMQADGTIMHELGGDMHHVSVADIEGEDHPLPDGLIYVHNHPHSLNSLSDMDLMMAHARAAKAIYAIAADRSVYRAADFKGANTQMLMMIWALRYMQFRDTYPRLSDEFATREDEQARRGDRPNEAHWINKKIAASKTPVFSYQYELGEKTAAIAARIDSRMTNRAVYDDL